MKTARFIPVFLALGLAGLFGSTARAQTRSAPLSSEQKTFLARYEAVRAALAADNLGATKKAAAVLVSEREDEAEFAASVRKIMAADSLQIARGAFKVLSQRAIRCVQGQEGYYVVNCPMAEGGGGDWVQTSKKINNPYLGKGMLTCGHIK